MDAEIAALVRAREQARADRDFARADALRAQIEQAGYVLKDTTQGSVASPAPRFTRLDPARIPNSLAEPPTLDVSLHLLYEGYPDDVHRFLTGFASHNDTTRAEVVLVDNASPDGDALEALDGVRLLRLDREVGWASARDAGLKTSKGAIVVLVDLSVEPVGDILTPLIDAFVNPHVGAAGPFGLASHDLREWHEDPGPEVAALEGYLLATRREILANGLIHDKFRWYRNADIDLSFQIRATGHAAVVVGLPVVKHVHRGWAALEHDPAEREKRSKRNHYVFFDRWKHREDLISVHPGSSGGRPDVT